MSDRVSWLLFGAGLINTTLILYLGYKVRQRFGKLDHLVSQLDRRSRFRQQRVLRRVAGFERKFERDNVKLEKTFRGGVQELRGKVESRLRREFADQRSYILQQFKQDREEGARMSAEIQRISTRVRAVKEHQADLGLQLSLNTLPLVFPVQGAPWSINGFLGRALVDAILERKPRVIVELGGGISSVLIAAALERLKWVETRHIAVDHLQEYLTLTRARLDAQGFARDTELWLCPLEDTPVCGDSSAPESTPWYQGLAERLTEKLGEAKIDLLLIDGPPAKLHPLSRRPALDRLRAHLSPGALVFLDDAKRTEEQATLEHWKNTHPGIEVYVSGDTKGYARISMPHDFPTTPKD